MTMTEDETRWAHAVHEAAHTVLLVEFNYHPVYASLDQTRACPTVLGCGSPLDWVPDEGAAWRFDLVEGPGVDWCFDDASSDRAKAVSVRTEIEDAIMAVMVGRIAQRRWASVTVETYCREVDVKDVDTLLRGLSPDPAVQQVWRQLLHLRTEHLVNQLKPKIRAVALALMDKERLETDDLKALGVYKPSAVVYDLF